ncbi:MAG: hypothetical protein KUG77_16295 [Nannocystaceae bacterium]|nr:hypothetical protein [Nannocystaceae bacterium]
MTRTLLTVSLVALACTPEFDDAPWRVEESRVLAIAASPAEARPGDPVMLTALTASPDGTVTAAPMWSVCTRPRASAERTSVTARCLEEQFLEPSAASMMVLSDACARFGPNPPPIEGDSAPRRPADPDASGGYFLPVRAQVGDAASFGAIRIRCDLPGVTRAIFDAFEAGYVANEPPELDRVSLDNAVLAADVVATIDALTQAAITVELPASAAEPYVRYDSADGVLVDEREWLRVQWFITDGRLSVGQQTLFPSETTPPVASTMWTAPPGPTTVSGWIVVTDARGGVGWSAFTIEVDA